MAFVWMRLPLPIWLLLPLFFLAVLIVSLNSINYGLKGIFDIDLVQRLLVGPRSSRFVTFILVVSGVAVIVTSFSISDIGIWQYLSSIIAALAAINKGFVPVIGRDLLGSIFKNRAFLRRVIYLVVSLASFAIYIAAAVTARLVLSQFLSR